MASIVAGQPFFRPHGRDLAEEAFPVGNVRNGSGGGGKEAFRVVLTKQLLHHVARPREPRDMIVVDERGPRRIVRRVSHEQRRAGHRQTGAELLVQNEAASRMKSRPPIVGVLEAPLQDTDFDAGVLRIAHIVPQLHKIIANAPQPGLEVRGLVLVVVAAKDVEVVCGEVDHRLAPVHVARALLSARDDPRPRSNGPQPAAVDVDCFGILLGREAVVHGLVVNLEELHSVRFGMSVGRPQLPHSVVGGSFR